MAVRKLLILIILPILSCAYFNTFYNARVYFKEAEKIYRTQGQNTRESSTNYNKAIEKCSKIFEFYKTSKYLEEALYITAISYKRIGNYTQAKIKFEELLKYYPDSRFKISALAEYLDILFTFNETNAFKDVLRKYPEIKETSEFLPIRIKMLFQEKDYKTLLELIDSNWKITQKHPLQKEILNFALESSIKIKDFSRSEKYLKRLEEVAKTDNEKLVIIQNRVKILTEAGDFEKAIQTLEKSPFNEEHPLYRSILLLKAQIFTQQGKNQEALDIIKNIEERSIRDSIFFSAIFLKGKILESIDSMRAALNIYQDLRNFPLSPSLREEVELRYKTLLEIVSDTTNGDENILRKAELFLFDLKNPEKALSAYDEVIEKTEQEGTKLKAHYAKFIIYYLYLKDYEKAREIGEKIIMKFPESTQAQKVEEILNLKIDKSKL